MQSWRSVGCRGVWAEAGGGWAGRSLELLPKIGRNLVLPLTFTAGSCFEMEWMLQL